MANEFVKQNLLTKIENAIREAQVGSDISHPGMVGAIREIALKNLFEPLLTDQIGIGSGKIIDYSGLQSKETDVILYSKDVLPHVLFSDKDDMGLYPAEICLYAIEVKSRVTVEELRDAYEKAKMINSLKYLSGIYGPGDRAIPHLTTRIVPAMFAFGSDLSGDSKSELERYIEIDPLAERDPSIRCICIVGKGCWFFRSDAINEISVGKWLCWKPTSNHEEIIGFLSGVLNTIPDAIASRGRPRFGEYLLAGQFATERESIWKKMEEGWKKLGV